MRYDYKKINAPLLAWYDEHARVLPWRSDPTPYGVWISEIMLQQTRVETVRICYARFLEAFPDIESLAYAPEDRLLKLWEGLGYYNRVRNMKKAAVTVVEEYNKKMPESYEELQKLPGIGSYTAGAIASIAFHIPVAAVDGNVLRVAMRLAADDSDIAKASVKAGLEKVLTADMDKKRPGEWNQALMDMGAAVCIPNGAPRCGECPLSGLCEARKQGLTEVLPVKTGKAKPVKKNMTVLVFCHGETYAIQKRPDRGLLAGLWEFPIFEGHLPVSAVEEVLKAHKAQYEMELLGEAVHVFSHIIWNMTGYEIRLKNVPESFAGCPVVLEGAGEEPLPVDLSKLVWKTREEIEKGYGIPSAFAFYKRKVWDDENELCSD